MFKRKPKKYTKKVSKRGGYPSIHLPVKIAKDVRKYINVCIPNPDTLVEQEIAINARVFKSKSNGKYKYSYIYIKDSELIKVGDTVEIEFKDKILNIKVIKKES